MSALSPSTEKELLLWVPIREYVNGWFHRSIPIEVWTGTIEGHPAWTDGLIAIIGTPPPACKVMGEKPIERIVGHCARPTLERVTPVAVVWIDPHAIVVFSNGSLAQVKYYNLIVHEWPGAAWFSDEAAKESPRAPIVAKLHGRLVACVAGMKPADWEPRIQGLLQTELCSHERLNEDGICRNCGADKRGIG